VLKHAALFKLDVLMLKLQNRNLKLVDCLQFVMRT